MKPKNTKERRNSFLKFLLLFVITTAVIVAAVFLTFRVPVKENSMLKDKAKNINKEIKFQKSFFRGMTKVEKLLDSLDVPGQNISYLNSLISKDLVELQKSIPRKSATHKYGMYTNVVNLLVDIQDMKAKLRELKDAENTIEEYKVELEKSQKQFEQLERDLIIARRR